MRNLRIGSIILLMLLNYQSRAYRKGRRRVNWETGSGMGDAGVDEFAAAQTECVRGQSGSHSLVDGDMPILCR